MKTKADPRYVFSRLYIDVNRDYRNTVLLAGSARSGTTWMAQIINHRNEFRMLFEPFYKVKGAVEWKEHNLRHYLRKDDSNTGTYETARRILDGNIRNPWVDADNRRFICRKRFMKTVHVNLILGWLCRGFPEMPIILMMRHPCAIALSRMKLGWDVALEDFLSQEELVQDHLSEYADELRDCSDPFDQQIYYWAVVNYVPLKQFMEDDDTNNGRIMVLHYENMLIDLESSVDRIFGFLGLQYDERVWESVKRPSRVVQKDSAALRNEDMVSSWKKKVTADEQKRAAAILARFGLDRIYDESPLPKNTECTINTMLSGM